MPISQIPIRLNANVGLVGNHARTQRATYTVPNGKVAEIEFASLLMYAGGAPAAATADFEIFITGGTYGNVYVLRLINGQAGPWTLTREFSGKILLRGGGGGIVSDVIAIFTTNTSGLLVGYIGGVQIREFSI